jgi:hypothetical protein
LVILVHVPFLIFSFVHYKITSLGLSFRNIS